jgi:hypothetical protein
VQQQYAKTLMVPSGNRENMQPASCRRDVSCVEKAFSYEEVAAFLAAKDLYRGKNKQHRGKTSRDI